MLEKPPVTIIDHANGGKGRIILEHIAGPETLRENARLFVKATLEKGCSMGVHKHKGDREIYHILSGKALYTDNDKTYEMNPGDDEGKRVPRVGGQRRPKGTNLPRIRADWIEPDLNHRGTKTPRFRNHLKGRGSVAQRISIQAAQSTADAQTLLFSAASPSRWAKYNAAGRAVSNSVLP